MSAAFPSLASKFPSPSHGLVVLACPPNLKTLVVNPGLTGPRCHPPPADLFHRFAFCHVLRASLAPSFQLPQVTKHDIPHKIQNVTRWEQRPQNYSSESSRGRSSPAIFPSRLPAFLGEAAIHSSTVDRLVYGVPRRGKLSTKNPTSSSTTLCRKSSWLAVAPSSGPHREAPSPSRGQFSLNSQRARCKVKAR
jgi:hypothetical protein